jgi:hypothetical protein
VGPYPAILAHGGADNSQSIAFLSAPGPDDLQRIEAAVAKVQIQGARYTAQHQKTIQR